MRASSRLLSLSAWLLAALAPPAAAGVIVVDPSGGGDFTDPSQALAAAVSGDIVILKPADYTTTTLFLDVDGKALVIAGDGGGPVTIPSLQVHNVPAGGTFVLRHLTFQPNTFTALTGKTVLIDHCAGNVHIEDCTIAGIDGHPALGFAADGLPGLLLSGNTGAVAIHRSTITGGKGQSTVSLIFSIQTPSQGAHAIVSDGGRLALYAVTATGGQGGDGIDVPAAGAPGGSGLSATGCEVIVSGATLVGGDGGTGTSPGLSGSGVTLTGAGSALSELDSTLVGGAGSPPLVLGGATHEIWPGQAWQIVLSSPQRSGEPGSFAVSGPPSCLFGLFISLKMGYQPIGKFKGSFLPASPFFGPQLIASTNGAGSFNATFLAPSLQPFGLEGLLNVDQALMVQPVDGLVLSSATAYVQYGP